MTIDNPNPNIRLEQTIGKYIILVLNFVSNIKKQTKQCKANLLFALLVVSAEHKSVIEKQTMESKFIVYLS